MTTEEAYRILALRPPVTAREVKLAYRRKAMEVHPDRFSSEEEKAYYGRRFMEAREAYEVLRGGDVPELADEPVPEPDFGPKTAGRSFAPEEYEHAALHEKLGLGLPWPLGTMLAWGLGLPLAVGVLIYFVKTLADALRGP